MLVIAYYEGHAAVSSAVIQFECATNCTVFTVVKHLYMVCTYMQKCIKCTGSLLHAVGA